MGIGCGQIKIRFMKYGFSLIADMRNFMVGLRKLFHQLKVRPVVVLVSSSLPNIALASSVLYLMLLGTLASCDPNKQHVKNELLEKISKKIYLIDSLKSFSIKSGFCPRSVLSPTIDNCKFQKDLLSSFLLKLYY